jgi:hypothetical protein
MDHKTSRPTPLKDLQIAVQADQSRRYLLLDAHEPSPAYPFDPPLQEAWQVRALALTARQPAFPCSGRHVKLPLE